MNKIYIFHLNGRTVNWTLVYLKMVVLCLLLLHAQNPNKKRCMKWIVTGINFGHFISLFEEFQAPSMLQWLRILPQIFTIQDWGFLLFNLPGCFGARRAKTLFTSIWCRSVWQGGPLREAAQELIFQLVVLWYLHWYYYRSHSSHVYSG